MNPQDILKYIDNPSNLGENSIIDLTLLTEQHPYFQVGQLLRVKNLHLLSPETIKPVLNYTAAYVTDRKILYYLLHPIQEKPVILKSKSPEKQIKDTIRENISDTLQNQKQQAETIAGEEIEFSTSYDLRKEYGEGVELDDYVVHINNSDKEIFELINDENTRPEPVKELVSHKSKFSDVDVLTLINKGVAASSLEDTSVELPAHQTKKNSLIDNFLKSNPRIVPVKPNETPVKDISEDSVKESDHLITDTLANIYLKQGNYAKAIFAYEKLCLKYPEKSTYFAAQIADIKKIIEKSK